MKRERIELSDGNCRPPQQLFAWAGWVVTIIAKFIENAFPIRGDFVFDNKSQIKYGIRFESICRRPHMRPMTDLSMKSMIYVSQVSVLHQLINTKANHCEITDKIQNMFRNDVATLKPNKLSNIHEGKTEK